MKQQYSSTCQSLSILNLLVVLFVSFALFSTVVCQRQNFIYKFQTIINANMNLTKSLSLSSMTPQLIVGSDSGDIKIFNIKTGNLDALINQQQMPIVSTVWIQGRDGLITVSTNNLTNQSIAVVRDRQTYQETFTWILNGSVVCSDYSQTLWQSYIGFNLGNRVEEYQLRSKEKSATFYGLRTKLFEISYSANHQYLFALGWDQNKEVYYVHHMPCSSNIFLSYSTDGTLSSLQADKTYSQTYPSILKETNSSTHVFRLQNADLSVSNHTFPSDMDFDQFRYCPSDYIIGVTTEGLIVLYSREYEFRKISQIEDLYNSSTRILQVVCKAGYLVVSTSNNMIYVYELSPLEKEEQINWTLIAVFIGIGFFVLIILVLLLCKKVKKIKQNKKINPPYKILEEKSIPNL